MVAVLVGMGGAAAVAQPARGAGLLRTLLGLLPLLGASEATGPGEGAPLCWRHLRHARLAASGTAAEPPEGLSSGIGMLLRHAVESTILPGRAVLSVLTQAALLA